SPGKKILAVVGAGHIEGIKQNLGKELDVAKISTTQNGLNYWKLIAYAIPVIFAVTLVYLFFTKGTGVTLMALAYWFLATGILAALGVILARGHMLSAIAAFLAAPLTTLHPLIAAGWVAGYVEAKMKNPKIKDFENLRNLNSFDDFTKNRVTKILLVVAGANLGATIGTILAFPLIASLFA
ncbi:MAG: TraB family protein, partial [archaeon]|nr:TraB family protein [archaeon]